MSSAFRGTREQAVAALEQAKDLLIALRSMSVCREAASEADNVTRRLRQS